MDNIIDRINTVFAPPPTDDVSEDPVYEAVLLGKSIFLTEATWRSWTGRRWVNGAEYHGPVFLMGTKTLYTGARACGCKVCQADVAPRHRKN